MIQTKAQPTTVNPNQSLTGLQKSAIFLVALGESEASKILANLNDDEVQKLAGAIAELPQIPPHVQQTVLREFHGHIENSRPELVDPKAFLNKSLQGRVDTKKLDQLATGVEPAGNDFNFLNDYDPKDIGRVLVDELPQTVAVVLTYCDNKVAAKILQYLPDDFKSDVAAKIARMGKLAPEAIKGIRDNLKTRMSTSVKTDYQTAGGVDHLSKILNEMDPNTGENILDQMATEDDGLASEVKEKLFTFDNLIDIGDHILRQVLPKFDKNTIALALKLADDFLQDKLLHNVSQNARAEIEENMIALGPQRRSDILNAQRQIVQEVLKISSPAELRLPAY